MITLSDPQTASLSDDVLTLATLYEIHRTDGTAFYLTDHDEAITYLSHIYSPAGGLSATAIQKDAGIDSRNQEISGVLSVDMITSIDLRAGRYQNAKVVESIVNWKDLTLGAYTTNVYWVDSVTYTGEVWKVALIGTTDWIKDEVGFYFNRGCRWKLFGFGCQKDSTGLIKTGTVTSISNPGTTFVATLSSTSADGYHDDGWLTWTTGLNTGLPAIEVKEQVGSTFTIWLKTKLSITVGDTFTVEPGCNHLPSDCTTKFANMINYGGFPFIPGTDIYIRTPNA